MRWAPVVCCDAQPGSDLRVRLQPWTQGMMIIHPSTAMDSQYGRTITHISHVLTIANLDKSLKPVFFWGEPDHPENKLLSFGGPLHIKLYRF